MEVVKQPIHEHQLKSLMTDEVPDHGDKISCLLCWFVFEEYYEKTIIHHCDVCNVIICDGCMNEPPPLCLETPTIHEHQLHLVSKRIEFTCNVCGTLGDQCPYSCLQCNFMIHRQCIDLPRVIKINRHDHRVSYTRRLGHEEERKCKVCRKKVDGLCGAYTCDKCPTFAVHLLCATRKDVWDMIELEGVPEEEEESTPFEVIDDNTIKHFSHEHNLQQINKDGHGQIQPENIVCEACVQQILSGPFYSCKHCHFILHKDCANLPRKKQHVTSNTPYTFVTDSRHEVAWCGICNELFTGFRYLTSTYMSETSIDVRCAAISDTLEHGSHQHLLYYGVCINNSKCSRCNRDSYSFYSCDECGYNLCDKCHHFPEKVMKNRYDDHLLFLSFGEKNADDDYWCKACGTKVDPKEWFYKCSDCETILHISCVVGDFSYLMLGSHLWEVMEVVSNTSRPLCFRCNTQCKLSSILKVSNAGVDEYVCSFLCTQ